MKQINRFLTFSQDDVTYRFLPGGDVFTFTNGSLLANQFRGNPKDGSVNNIYLRIYKKDGIQAYPLLGVKSGSKVSVSDSCLCQSGSIEGISYDVAFRPVGHIWFWDVTLSGDGQDIDLVYGQDLGVVSGRRRIHQRTLYVPVPRTLRIQDRERLCGMFPSEYAG